MTYTRDNDYGRQVDLTSLCGCHWHPRIDSLLFVGKGENRGSPGIGHYRP